MTIDEAIKHCEEQANLLEESAAGCDMTDKVEKEMACRSGKCAAEHRQLAKWLRELKAYRGILANADKIIESEYGCVIVEGYKDVIDQMNEVYKDVNDEACEDFVGGDTDVQ